MPPGGARQDGSCPPGSPGRVIFGKDTHFRQLISHNLKELHIYQSIFYYMYLIIYINNI